MKKLGGIRPIKRDPKRMPRPTSVGEMIVEEFLKPLRMSDKEFSKLANIDVFDVEDIIKGTLTIDAEMATKIGKAFNTTPEFWLNLRNANDAWAVRHPKRKK